MAGKIKVYSSDLTALGSTSKAFSITKTEELMREFTLSFSIVNNDSVYPLISENSVLEYQGQKFDISGIDSNSGITNITQITAEHISYRLADYTIPNGYSFVGTISEIANDILEQAKTVDEVSASTVFSIGSCADKGTVSFAMPEAQNMTAREALISMSELGVEIEFDNFTVNIPEQRGTDNGMTFDYDRNLSGVHRTWQKGNGWTYDIAIADLQKIPNHSGDVFGIGDYVTINDKLSSTTQKDRIISYTECDDPTQNRITVGVFIRDNASMAIETDNLANVAFNKSKGALQEGEKYSNVSLDHIDGFKSESRDGLLRVVQNADDCFAIQVKDGGTWRTVTSAELWGMLTPRLTTQESKNSFYATTGKTDDDNFEAFKLYVKNTLTDTFNNFFSVYCPSSSGEPEEGAFIESPGHICVYLKPGKSFYLFRDGKQLGITETITVGSQKITVEDGFVTKVEVI
jgi:hypothetical protein